MWIIHLLQIILKDNLKFFGFLFFFFVLIQSSIGQDRCSIIRYQEILNKKFPNRESQATFEKWMANNIRLQGTKSLGVSTETYTIPVVVHVIHNGEAIGTGSNISDAQIQSQIDVLNKDFRRLNSDANKTPNDFLGVAGSLSVQFVLARRNPDGLASDGIVRINGGKTSWSLTEEGTFKSLSFWPSEDYLNLWVINLTGSDIGYASFPVSNLPGMEDAVNNRLIDGVIIDYKVFGSKDYGNFDLDSRYSVGRTATHEIGHYLGLRHIWGDVSGCSGTDYVTDTPPQNGATFDCPTTHPIISCNNTAKMYQNFMDYTQDACMNLFTKNQVDRMVVVLENSPRRKSLSSSLGSISPNYNLEASLSVLSPQSSGCPGPIVPTVLLRNLGELTIESVKVNYSINGQTQNPLNFSVSLLKGQTTTLSFPEYILNSGQSETLAFELAEINGGPDELLTNNFTQVVTIGSNTILVPFQENFSTLPNQWTITNPDDQITWSQSNAGNGSVYINSYNYEQPGAQDALITPVFNASNVEALLLQFSIAYARYPNNNEESLSVYVIDDCSTNYSNGTLVYQKQGNSLATAPDNSREFFPSNQQWRTETINIDNFIGLPNLRLAFVFKNVFGNNLYLDQIRIRTSPYTDLQITSLAEPSPAVCISEIQPKILISNLGTTAIENISGIIKLTSGLQQTIPSTNIQLNPGESKEVTLPKLNLSTGLNLLGIEIFPVENQDGDLSNNQKNFTITYITTEERIPSRENFEINSKWTPVVQFGSAPWETTSTNLGTSISYQAFSNFSIGEQGWLVSPIMDLSKQSVASLFTDLSYGSYQTAAENIKLVASTDCGKTFTETFFDGPIDELVSLPSPGNFIPVSENDWSRAFFDISSVAGQKKVLFGFIITNNNGSNVFLDNIEFYADNDPNPVIIDELFSVYRDEDSKQEKITFNLPERSTVQFQMLTSTGLTVLNDVYEDVLNQTITLDLGLPSGLYIYRFLIQGRYYAVRHFVP